MPQTSAKTATRKPGSNEPPTPIGGKNQRNCGEADGRKPRQRREVFEMVNTEIGEACSLRAEAVDDQRHAKMKTQRPYSVEPATRENIAAAS